MYIPSSFAERDVAALFAFIEAHPLATLVTTSPTDGLIATHLPLVLDRNTGPSGTLFGHLARANPHARVLGADGVPALVMFLGPVSDAPDDYIAAQMKAIVGLHLQIDRLEGKWKMSQNRSDADAAGVVHGLSMSGHPRDREVARIIEERRRPERG